MTAELVRVDHAEIAQLAPDPSQYVVAIMEQSRQWLSTALAFDNVRDVMEARSQANALSTYAREKQLSVEAQLAAAEMTRRSERALAVCVATAPPDTFRPGGARPKDYRPGSRSPGEPDPYERPVKTDYLGPRGKRYTAMGQMKDADDSTFDEVIDEARRDGDLSRSNVVKKLEERRGDTGELVRRTHRRPLPDLVKEAGWDARNSVDKLAKYLTDERYTQQPRNRELINPHLQSHLEAIAATCGRMLSDIRNRTLNDQDEGSSVLGGDGGAG